MRGIQLLIFSFILILSARAQTSLTWFGDGSDSNWSTIGNWSSGTPSPTGGTASLTFNDSSLTNFTPFIEQNYDIDSLHFFASTASFDFDGAPGVTLTLENSSLGMDMDTSGNVSFSSNITFNLPQAQEWDVFANSLQINGVISGVGVLTLRGSGSLILNSTNTYTGGTILEDGLFLSLNANDALGSGPLIISGDSTIAAQGNLTLENAVTIGNNFGIGNSTNAALTLAGPVTLAGSPAISISSDSSSPLIITGDVSESGGPQSLTINGGGVLQLSGNNTYSGGTMILGSTVIAGSDSALGSGNVALGNADFGGTLAINNGFTLTNPLTLSNGTLAGLGTFAPSSGALTIGSGLTVSPGFIQTNSDHMPVNGSIGTLTFSPGLTLDSGGTLALKFINATGTAGTDWDFVSVNGTLSLTATSGSPFNLTLASYSNTTGAPDVLAGFDSSSSYTWQIASGTSMTGFDPSAFNVDTSSFQNSLGTGQFFLTQSGNDLFLNFTPVPEPSTVALLSLGASVLVVAGRRRRRR